MTTPNCLDTASITFFLAPFSAALKERIKVEYEIKNKAKY